MAGETENIGKIADLLAKNILREFGWTRIGPTNENFPCNSPQEHKGRSTATHPADVVFYYDDAYSNTRIYVHFDLKSFAASTFGSGPIRAALKSLSQTITCARRSSEWRQMYEVGASSVEVVGGLFVYNHDGSYSGDFAGLVETAVSEDFALPPGKKIVVFGPDEIAYLNTVATDMRLQRDEDDRPLPARGQYKFRYPDLVLHRKRVQPTSQATLEMLTGPMQVITYNSPVGTVHLVYYRHSGESVDEFLYLFDYFFRFQMLEEGMTVRLRLVSPSPEAPAMFGRAIEQYAELYAHQVIDFRSIIRSRLDAVSLGIVQNVVSQFSSLQIGMGYASE